MIEENERLSQNELIKRLGISKPTFLKHKKDILLELSDAWEYEVEYKSNKIIYHFIKKYFDYKYIGSRNKQLTERDKDYKGAIVEELSERPLNTAANVARVIQKEWPEIIEKYHYTSGYHYEICRTRMRKWFGTSECDNPTFDEADERVGYIKEKVWCRLDGINNVYIPLTDEEIQQFYELVNEAFKNLQNDEISLCEDYNNGMLSESDFAQSLKDIKYTAYCAVKNMYKTKMGFIPIKVPYYVVYNKEFQDAQ